MADIAFVLPQQCLRPLCMHEFRREDGDKENCRAAERMASPRTRCAGRVRTLCSRALERAQFRSHIATRKPTSEVMVEQMYRSTLILAKPLPGSSLSCSLH